MVPPPRQLDGADVLWWAVSGPGGFYQLQGSDPPVTVMAMAVARYQKDGSLYLFKCDENCEVVADWDCDSVDEAKRLAQQHAGTQSLEWQRST